MSWKIVYTSYARQDLRNIYSYIANELLSPETANAQIRRIMEKTRSLSEMPMRFRLYVDEPWHSRGLRTFPVDNYLVFYLPKEHNNTVDIVRIIYGGRDIRGLLSETAPKSVEEMSKAEFDLMMQTGLAQAKNGESLDADEVFKELI